MTNEQLQLRVKWLLQELKDHHIIPDDIILDNRFFAIRSAKHVITTDYYISSVNKNFV